MKPPSLIFGKHKGVSIYDVPVSYFRWMQEVKIIDRVKSFRARCYIHFKLGLPQPEKKLLPEVKQNVRGAKILNSQFNKAIAKDDYYHR